MNPTSQPTATPAAGQTPACSSCGAPLAADQRYCLSCGSRVGEPRVPTAPMEEARPPAEPPAPASRQADVSPLAAVIGIALLGGMLLIGVLIGRGTSDDPPAPVVQVGEATGSTTTPSGGDSEATTPADAPSGAITSEWPAGTDGFTIQLSTVAKSDATPESVDAAQQSAVANGAADAAVLDSDLYSSLPPGNYVIYSGVFTDRKSAKVALNGLGSTFSSATVVEVAGGSADAAPADQTGADSSANDAAIPGAGGESEVPPTESNK